MCGITAHVGADETVEELLAGLENLEYRGYDSAGVAVKNGCGVEVCKRRGEISELKQQIRAEISASGVGIGHTRWSTHGPPTDTNAHPHTDCTGEVAVVHNGIVDNHDELKARLKERGHSFESDTDTEVVPHLVEEYRDEGLSPEPAFREAVQQLEGSYAVAMIVEDEGAVYATRSGSPLVMGVADGERFLASDAPAFLEFTDRVIYLKDGDVAVLTESGHRITDIEGTPVERPPETVDWVAEDAEKGGYDHYMLKEIHEQPTALSQTLQGRVTTGNDAVTLEDFGPGAFANVSDVQFVACGTSYHAALYATSFLASRGIQAQAFRAGEYATSPAPLQDETLVVGVTQSGETADTLDSLRSANARGARTLALTNVVGSTAAREADDALFIRAGPEIGVAATKTFSSQIATLALLGERIVRDVSGLPSEGVSDLLDSLETLDRDVQRVIDESRAEQVASSYLGEQSYFFIGRDIAYPVALEGALKFKEITYEHAEGFAAGELKHGPLALVTPETPVFAVFTGRHDEKTLNNVEQVQARGAPVIAVASESNEEVHTVADEVLTYPDASPEVAAVLANVQLQLVSYHVADRLERAIDKPRNLAKSVTVK
jgi:glucosamine--fructose-6-phosphate aminotransferase (isomerizing)